MPEDIISIAVTDTSVAMSVVSVDLKLTHIIPFPYSNYIIIEK